MEETSRTGRRLHIRRAGAEDADEVSAMVREIAEHENAAEAVAVGAQDWRVMLGEPAVHVLVAEADGRLVGYVSAVRQLNLWLGRDILALDDLYVRPGFRNGGVGERLMTALAGVAAEDRLLIRWEMLEDNHAAQRFYGRLGATLRTKVIAVWPLESYRGRVPEVRTSP
jgi:GNAT superfamily N-acetyltransferase